MKRYLIVALVGVCCVLCMTLTCSILPFYRYIWCIYKWYLSSVYDKLIKSAHNILYRTESILLMFQEHIIHINCYLFTQNGSWISATLSIYMCILLPLTSIRATIFKRMRQIDIDRYIFFALETGNWVNLTHSINSIQTRNDTQFWLIPCERVNQMLMTSHQRPKNSRYWLKHHKMQLTYTIYPIGGFFYFPFSRFFGVCIFFGCCRLLSGPVQVLSEWKLSTHWQIVARFGVFCVSRVRLCYIYIHLFWIRRK